MEMIKPLTIDEIYISPFTARRVYDDDGFVHWKPIERNVHPTGLRQVDAVIQAYAEGVSDAGVIAERLGCRREDIRGLVRVLTGMDIREFRHACASAATRTATRCENRSSPPSELYFILTDKS